MFTVSEAQLTAWLTPLVWPFVRVLAMFTSAPVLGLRSVPVRVKVALAFFIAVAAQASLPEAAPIALDSARAVEAAVQNVLVGLALGFAARVVFAGIEFAGEVIGLQMGLNFASFFDPLSATQSTAVSRFFGTSAAWLFILMNGHLLLTVLAVGLLISIFQAATQIHEQTLSFVPKLIAAVAVLAVAGPWMLTSIVEYLQRTLQAIPTVVG